MKPVPRAMTPPGASAPRLVSAVLPIVELMDIVRRTTPAPATPALRELRVMTVKMGILAMTAGLVREDMTAHATGMGHAMTGVKGAVGVHAAPIGLGSPVT